MLLGSARIKQLRKIACRGIDETTWKEEPSRRRRTVRHPVLQTKDVLLVPNLDLANAGLDSYLFDPPVGFNLYLGLPLAGERSGGRDSFLLFPRSQRDYSDEEIKFLTKPGGSSRCRHPKFAAL